MDLHKGHWGVTLTKRYNYGNDFVNILLRFYKGDNPGKENFSRTKIFGMKTVTLSKLNSPMC